MKNIEPEHFEAEIRRDIRRLRIASWVCVVFSLMLAALFALHVISADAVQP